MVRSFITAVLVGLVAAQSSTTQATLSQSTTQTTLSRSTTTSSTASAITVFTVPGGLLNSNYQASIIGGDACRTTYGVKCIAENCGDASIPIPSGFSVAITEGPYFQQFSTVTSTEGVTISVGQSCGISGKTSATCVLGFSVSIQGRTAISTAVTTRAPAAYGTVSVTGGTIPSGSCTSTGNAALPTAFVDVYKVAVVPAAALAAAVLI